MSGVQATAPAQEASCGHAYDALVIGGGLAGSALAITLAQSGRSVVLLEKTRGAHPKVCGEFLSHEALHYLAALGLEPLALGAVPIEGVRLARRAIIASVKLPFPALSLSRERLDEALLIRVARAGVSVHRGRRVDCLTSEGDRWRAQVEGTESTCARSAFLATGKHDLHGWARPKGKQDDLIAFKMHFRLSLRQQADLDRHVELILFAGGYAGLQPVENGFANLCLLVTRHQFRSAGSNWPELLEHMQRDALHLAMRLDGATEIWEKPLSLSSIPYGLVCRTSADRLWRLGDQSAVIPSFAGDGMSIALHSAWLAATIYCAGGDANAYQRQLADTVRRQVGLATLISRSLVGTPRLMTTLSRLLPGALTMVAGATRIPSRDMVRSGFNKVSERSR